VEGRKKNGVLRNRGGVDPVPNRQNDLATLHLQHREPVELVLWPVLRKERVADEHDAERTVAKSVVDVLTKAVPHCELTLIDPYSMTAANQRITERAPWLDPHAHGRVSFPR
jgi:hypothetical protein